MDFPHLFSPNVSIRSSFSVRDQVSHPYVTIFNLLREIREPHLGHSGKSLVYWTSGSNTAHCLRENKIFCLHSKTKFYSTQYSLLFAVTYEFLSSSLCSKTLLTVSLVCKQGTYVLFIYRVIHKSLRDFRTRLRNNQDRHGRKEHINR